MHTSVFHACLSVSLNICVAAFQELVSTDIILRFFLKIFLWKDHVRQRLGVILTNLNT